MWIVKIPNERERSDTACKANEEKEEEKKRNVVKRGSEPVSNIRGRGRGFPILGRGRGMGLTLPTPIPSASESEKPMEVSPPARPWEEDGDLD